MTHRMLELGCGTGQVTDLRAGADALEAEVGSAFHRVVLAFVLHNFDADGRLRLLRRAAGALTTSGSIGILDWAAPTGRIRAGAWRRFLRTLEPSPSVGELLDGALVADIATAGLRVERRSTTAGGRVQVVIARHGGETGSASP